MVFSDLFFLFVFLPLFALLYLLAARRDSHDSVLLDSPQQAYKNHVLILFSLIFYAWGEPVYVFLMLGCVAFNYLIGIIIDRSPIPKFFLIFGLLGNLATLGTYKYADFLAHTLNAWGLSVKAPGIALPIGISFYTFQSMSYLIDVYRKEAPAQYRFGRLLLYVSMFPQLVAGPIVRYGTVAEEIGNRRISTTDFAEGAYRFLIGLSKKVLLANQFSEIVDQFLRGSLHDLSTTGAWIGILAFAFQIYFDFSGYSDMAIGMGRCLGFHFNENFNHPYISRSITEFWRRWHMSLGSFFRDYVYIPMGGNRRHQALNILCVWFLTGLWHGASWNFVLWGVYFGLIVLLEKYTLLRIIHFIPSPLLHLYSLLLILIGWGIFYFDDFSRLLTFFSISFGRGTHFHDFVTTGAFFDHFWLWIAALALSTPIRRQLSVLIERIPLAQRLPGQVLQITFRISVSILLLTLSVALLVGATNNAFIYTRF